MSYYLPVTVKAVSSSQETCDIYLYDSLLTKLIGKSTILTPSNTVFPVDTYYADMLPLVLVVRNRDTGAVKSQLVEELYESPTPLSEVIYHTVDNPNNITYSVPDYVVIKSATTNDADLTIDTVSGNDITASYVGANPISSIDLEVVDITANTHIWTLVLIYSSGASTPTIHSYSVTLPDTVIRVPASDLLSGQPLGSGIVSFPVVDLFYGRVSYLQSRTGGILRLYYTNTSGSSGVDQFVVSTVTPDGVVTDHSITFETVAQDYDVEDTVINISSDYSDVVIDLENYIENYRYQSISSIIPISGIGSLHIANDTDQYHSKLRFTNTNNEVGDTVVDITLVDPENVSHTFQLTVTASTNIVSPPSLAVNLLPFSYKKVVDLLSLVTNADNVNYHGIGDNQNTVTQSETNNGIHFGIVNNLLELTTLPESIDEAKNSGSQVKVWMKDDLDRYTSTTLLIDTATLNSYELPQLSPVGVTSSLLYPGQAITFTPSTLYFRDDFDIISANVTSTEPQRFDTLLLYTDNGLFSPTVNGNQVTITPPSNLTESTYWLVLYFKVKSYISDQTQKGYIYFELTPRPTVLANDTTIQSKYFNEVITFSPTSNDTTITGNPSLTITQQPAGGTLNLLSNLQARYKSSSSNFDTDSFTYSISDDGQSDSAQVFINRWPSYLGYDMANEDALCTVNGGDAQLLPTALRGNNLILTLPTTVTNDNWTIDSITSSTNSYTFTNNTLTLLGNIEASSAKVTESVNLQLLNTLNSNYLPFTVKMNVRLLLGDGILITKSMSLTDSEAIISFSEIGVALAASSATGLDYTITDAVDQPDIGGVVSVTSGSGYVRYTPDGISGLHTFYVQVYPNLYPNKRFYIKLAVLRSA